jgi:glycyl-tRNA synthetase
MDFFDKIFTLGKRRGFIWPSFEIYGGIGGLYDYGPMGTLLKKNIEDKWRDYFVRKEEMVEISSTVIAPHQVFEASGHVAHFTDVMTTCTSCGKTFRTDHVLKWAKVGFAEGTTMDKLDELVEEHDVKCPECHGMLSKSEPFNLMFEMTIGPFKKGITAYGRPEAAQGQFTAFKRVFAAERERLPLGVAQIGKCLRNEISPRQGPIRLREFTIIDYEVFFDPENMHSPRIKEVEDFKLPMLLADEQIKNTDRVQIYTVREALERELIKNEILAYFLAKAVKFAEELGLSLDKQRLREQLPEERAHYSKETFDQEIWTESLGWVEVSGHAYRTNYDLSRHMIYSGVDTRVFKRFDESREIEKTVLTPEVDTIRSRFGDQADRVIDLLKRADPEVLEENIKAKGFYELPGTVSLRVTSEYVRFTTVKEKSAGKYFTPHVVEPSFGVDRIFYAVLEHAYTEKNSRIILHLPRDVAPVKLLVLPLVNKDGLPEKAKEVYDMLLSEGFYVAYDYSGSVGRRYARADEIGVPLCLTIDYQTMNDDTVTLRDRDTWIQVRTDFDDLPDLLRKYFNNKIDFNQLGT